MAQRRGPVIAWSGSVAGVALAAATLIATVGKKPLSDPWFIALAAVAAAASLILLAAGLPDLAAWLSGWPAAARRASRRPVRLVTSRWHYTSDGARAPAAMTATEIVLPGTGYMRQPGERPPWARFVVLLACSPISPDADTAQLRSRFLTFLGEPAAAGLVAALTSAGPGVSWKKWSTGRPSAFDAVLTGAGEAQAIASARLELPDGLRYHGRDTRRAALILHVEQPGNGSTGALRAPPEAWAGRIQQALDLPGALAAFLSQTVGLRTSGEPPAQVGVRLEAPGDLGALVDTTGMDPLPGGHRKAQAIGYFTAARDGVPAAAAAGRMVRHVLQYALNVDPS